MARVAIEIEGMEPGELALPTSEGAIWWLTGRHTHGEVIHVEGDVVDVLAFVRAHWGDDEVDGYGTDVRGPGRYLAAYEVPAVVAVQ